MKPPVFYPKKPLKAADLIGLENYLLSLHQLVSKDYGIIQMKHPQYNGDGFFCLNNLSGFTFDGTPVVLSEKEYLICRDVSRNGPKQTADFYILDKHPVIDPDYARGNADAIELNPIYFKYTIEYLPVNRENDEVFQLPHSLYVGRYECGAGELKNCQPPYFYNIQSAQSFLGDSKWAAWTEAIRKSLNEILNKSANTPILQYKISEFIFNYLTWPISTLFKSCVEINWLTTFGKNVLDPNALISLANMQKAGFTKRYLPGEFTTRVSELLNFDSPIPDYTALFIEQDYVFEGSVTKFLRNMPGATEFTYVYEAAVPNTFVDITNKGGSKTPQIALANQWTGTNNVTQYMLSFKYERDEPLNAEWKTKVRGIDSNPIMIYYRRIK